MSYIANTPEQISSMLKTCGVSSISELFSKIIPSELAPKSFNLPEARSEMEVYEYFKNLACKNYTHLTCFLGGGFYDHFIPSAVDALASRAEFYTAYTPYQPELSQGTLQAIYEYQTHICRLTEMEVSNASLYDGGTALCEACQMALHITNRNKIVVDGGVNPVYRTMLRSYTSNLSIELQETPMTHGLNDRDNILSAIDSNTAAVILQNPNFFGVIDDFTDIFKHAHQQKAISIISVYPISLAILKTPGEMGADIATGEGQSLGIPLSFGGPYLGFMATRMEFVRKMPGRIVGRTVDRNGKEAFVLTLQAREQHIRREKATSNICTNESLCALRAHIYLTLVGKEGLKQIANLCHAKAIYAMERLSSIRGVEINSMLPVFNEFVVRLPKDAGEVAGAMVERGIAPGLPLGRFYKEMSNCLLVAVTEKRTKYEIGMLAETLEKVLWQ
jgi:glycine dehydrogenase subunit 1